MYEKKELAQPEHILVAHQMVGEILSFPPDLQNEILKAIDDRVRETRYAQIAEMEERCNFLRKTLEELGL